MSVPRRSEAPQTDAPLRAAKVPAGKSPGLLWLRKEPDIRLHLLFGKYPPVIKYTYNLKSLGDLFRED